MSEAVFVNVYIENMKTALFDEIAKHLITKSQLDLMSKQLEEATAKLQKLEAKNKKIAE
jgi:hypothetical protein